MRAVTVMLCLTAATALAGLQPAMTMPPPTVTPHRAISAPQPAAPERPAAPWLGLEQLSPAERTNAQIHIDPGMPGADDAVRRIEQLWDSGDHDEALAQFRNLGGSCDLRNAFVGINWRMPIPTLESDDWGPNVRIGNRESTYCTAFDRNSVNGNLLVALLRHRGAQTYIDVYLSTDGGQTWSETYDGYWNSPPSDLDGVCCDTGFFVAYPYPPINLVLCMRFSASNGQMIPFPSGAYADTVFEPAPDTVAEISMCSGEEQWPGQRVFTFGRTTGDSLLYAYADGTGEPWHRFSTTVDWCNAGMIDCTVNPGHTTGRWLWVSWMYRKSGGDTLRPAFAYVVDTTGTWVTTIVDNLPTLLTYGTTSIAAWRDTVLIAYTHEWGSTFYTQALITYAAGSGLDHVNVPDTLALRDMPDVTGGHGDGFAVAHREYGSDRAIMYTHSNYLATDWSAQDSASDHSPTWIEKPRIQWLASGTYGVAYVSWDPTAYNSVWFSRTDWTGVADRNPARPALFGLRAILDEGGVRLAFDNPATGKVSLRVFDAAGRLAHSEDRMLAAGHHTLGFAGTTAGIYFAQLEAAGKAATAKFFIAR